MDIGNHAREFTLAPEFPGAARDHHGDGEEWGTGGGDGVDGGIGGGGLRPGWGPPRIWVCGHCVEERVLQMKEQGEW